jgi:CxxC-x17-CxxC domain-containing protein
VSFTDKVLRCRDCSMDFTFTAGEQEFYALKGLTNEPGRCPECRSARRSQREGGGYGGGSYSSGGGGYGGGYDRPRREMHPAVCAQCGQETQVPFLPRGDRPVYCSSCFEQVRVGR